MKLLRSVTDLFLGLVEKVLYIISLMINFLLLTCVLVLGGCYLNIILNIVNIFDKYVVKLLN